MAAIVFALLSAALYGSADFLGGLASRRSSVMPVMIFSQLAGLLTLLLVLAFLPAATAIRADFAWGAVAGGALGIGLMLLYQGLATGKMSVVAPVTAVLAVVVSSDGHGDRRSLVGGRVHGRGARHHGDHAYQSRRHAGKGQRRLGRGTRARCCAFGQRPDRRVFRCTQADQSWFRPIATGCGAAGRARCPRRRRSLAAAAVAHRARRGVADRRRGALDIFANVLYLLATREGMLTIAATLTSLYPASTILLARLVLGERLRRIQIAGLACAGLGVVLLSTG
jgi:uncharacterized membrane protein